MTDEIKKISTKKFVSVVVIFIVAVSIIVGIPYYQTFVGPWYKPVLEVRDKSFNRKYFMKRLRMKLAGVKQNQQTISIMLIEEIQNKELSRREAEKRGITVTAEEVDKAVQARVKQSSSGEGDFGHLYESLLRGLRLDPEDFEEMVRSDLIENKLFNSFLSEIPEESQQVFVKIIETATAKDAEAIRTRLAIGESFSKLAKEESIHLKSSKAGGDLGWFPKGVWALKATGQVRARGILTKTAEEAELIREQIESGSNFAQLAKKYSLDETSRANGGELGWVSTQYKKGKQFAAQSWDLKEGELSEPLDTAEGFWIIKLIEKSPDGNIFDDYVFNLPIGKVTPPLDTNQGFYLFKVIEKNDRWPLIREYRYQLANNKMDTWLKESAKKGSDEEWIKWHWGSASLNWALSNLNE